MSEAGSVTVWLGRLKAGEGRDEAASQLWARYFSELVTRARRRLHSRASAADGEDIALAAFDSFVRAAEAGRFPRLDHRDDLWQVLLALTARKAANAVRDEKREKRGGGLVMGLIGGGDPEDGGPVAASTGPDPAEVAALAEGVEQLLHALGSDELRQVAVWAFEGYTNSEIADRLGRSVATAERKLRLIRKIWSDAGLVHLE